MTTTSTASLPASSCQHFLSKKNLSFTAHRCDEGPSRKFKHLMQEHLQNFTRSCGVFRCYSATSGGTDDAAIVEEKAEAGSKRAFR